jgi:hypothetical protein
MSSVYRSLVVLSVLVIRNVQWDVLSFNDVIDKLPTDSFVKVFRQGVRPYDIFETRTPILLWRDRPDRNSKYNKTFLCKLFLVGRNIGSRTHNIINIKQIAMPTDFDELRKYSYERNVLRMVFGELGALDRYSEIPDPECDFDASSVQTIILGNNALYKTFTDNLAVFSEYTFLEFYIYKHNVALLFDLRGSLLSSWKICRVIRIAWKGKRLCLDGNRISQDMFDSKLMTKTSLGEKGGTQKELILTAGQFTHRKGYFTRSLNKIVATEIYSLSIMASHFDDTFCNASFALKSRNCPHIFT